ncbi:F-box protein [Raphanus sativus]|nr:F-box protein [Raphanus sativus]KAJ4879871.1 F-box protein [Raphanus sativus]
MLRMKYTDQPRVFTLGGQESWRIITKGRCPMHSPTGGYGRCFNGILYYEAHDTDGHRIIMSFDVKHENFNLIKLPEGCYQLPCHMTLHEGRLALVPRSVHFGKLDLYILKNPNRDEWLHEKCFLDIPASVFFNGVTAAGELVFTTAKKESLSIVYFNPSSNIMRVALFEGIVGGDFRRRYGLSSYGDIYNISVFPNHSETLVSF